jgi:DNA-binding FadR family transcriptional regulator
LLPLQAIETRRLYQRIADQVATLIVSGEFAPGTRLMGERDLAKLLRVSRPSVREAMIALEIRGLVEVRLGSGIHVRPGARASARPMDEGSAPFELLAARRLIEGEIAALAARKVRRRDLDKLAAPIERLRSNSDRESRDAADLAFHQLIAEVTGNSSLVRVVHDLWNQRRGSLWTRLEEHLHTPDLRARTVEDHEGIAAALAARNPEAARAAMHRHLDRVTREFQRELNSSAPRSSASTAGAHTHEAGRSRSGRANGARRHQGVQE